ncbi:MAG: MarR family winged helix-turn-helix transcriptional regulator [Spirochaetes bacterium]|nr:MarR family winged helix-turn-helix transcriptional regulator [Spirochaetota bacterium]
MKGVNPTITLLDVLNKIFDAKKAFLWKLAQRYHLTPLQIQILCHIHKCAPSANISAHEIAQELYITRATMSVAVKSLVKKGFIRKSFDSSDNRKQHLKLAAKSKKILNEIKRFESAFVSHFSQFSPNSISTATGVLVQMLAFMQDAGMVDRVSMCAKCNHCSKISQTTFRCELTQRTFSIDGMKIGCCRYEKIKAINE